MKPSEVTAHDHVDGPANARVTLIEYGDYECPFCAKAFPVIEAVRAQFANDLRFVYRHVPKSGQGFAKQAAEASEFAAESGKFWEMHRQLFEHSDGHDLEHLVEAAQSIGLDGDACRKALVDHRLGDRVRELAVASVRSGIIGTPTLFINGVHYENRIESPLLNNAIQQALSAG